MESIHTEVRKFVQDRIDSGSIIRTEWLTAEYLGSKSKVEGDDVGFYRTCALAHVSEVIKQVIGKFNPKRTKTDEQLLFPGFEHMQKAYPVKRDGIHLIVPVELLTDEELEERAAEYDRMAQGCRDHARELREYRLTRASMAA